MIQIGQSVHENRSFNGLSDLRYLNKVITSYIEKV
jgi:hypothetical protein